MCRWIAYRGERTAFEHYVTEPEHSLVTQSLRALESTAGTNGDGFGLGWYGDHPEPGLYRETRPAWSDENLRYLCRHLHSHLFFAHVRAATGTAVTRQNCHPFACGRWLFMHNGFVGSWNRLRRKVEAMIPDGLYPSRLGTTDSEAVFLAMVGAGIEQDPIGATRKVLRSLCELVNEDGLREHMRFTSALSNGHDLYAFRFAANDRANSLYYREDGDQVIAVSEPYDKEPDWIEVPPDHVLVARASRPAEIVPLFAAGQAGFAAERKRSQRVIGGT
ncbi:class II glutamine amidotransferase [Bradyrhizobium sp. 83012]|uniref:Class II glutamine amidotransferase n=1 Tax=Bradyrhizobium aeschynomenes TaxID=2734909 RepID=A0ABX2CF87_9BRAD|nr:class II glutamine amidotransferase [Bradyrhizobium aeschynomenes]NPU13262.1 class II glutamine amidotransferase [Bradyrhizobium aeschynomenes]NPU66538.1 class II glutamine amidotransferase [Bradyrhizobium aeschynomenes]NPV20250.1 class II glutamine amidotransferase [Bradyrhizobium aeschynomenes]